jgi:AraC-like DNA-binding protein
MSPIQFQKHIRLEAARLLLANHPNDVTGVGNRVGYDSGSARRSRPGECAAVCVERHYAARR